MLQLADSSENGWGVVSECVVAEYKGYDFVDDEEDNKKMGNNDRSTKVKKRHMESAQ